MLKRRKKLNNRLTQQNEEKRSEVLLYRSGIIIRVVLGVFITFILYTISRDSYLLYHDLVETFSIIIAIGIFLIIWNSYKHLENYFFLILAVGIAFSAIFDLVHMIGYKGMNIISIPNSDPANLATQLWLIARFIQAGTCIAALFIYKKVSRWKVAAIYILISGLFFLFLFVLHLFPVAYTAGHLTLFKKVSEYVISGMFLVATILVSRRRRDFDKAVYRLLMASLILTIFSELSFTLYADVYGIMNFAGHILKVLAYYMLYRAIIVSAIESPNNFLFRRLILNENKLKREEKALRVINSQLKKEYGQIEALLSSIGDGVVAMDRDGRIQYTNPAFNRLVGKSSEELVGHIISDVLPFYDDKGRLVPNSARPLWLVVSRKKFTVVKRNNFHILNQNGQQVNLSVTATPVMERGRITGGIVIFRDSTKEKEIERTKTEYIAFAAHQLRTPLSTIGLTMEVVQKELSKKKPSDVSQYLNDIVEEADIMADTVDQFLNVTKIEANLFILHPRLVSVPQVISDHLRLRGPHLENKKIEVETDFDPLVPAIKADPKVLEMIIENLFSNAIKYTKENGWIKVTVKNKYNSIIISVKDNGMGIPKEDQSKVFKKLFRASNIGKSEGTGLGLYIVRLLVTQSGGKIWFDSNEKETTFYVSYPLTGMKVKNINPIS